MSWVGMRYKKGKPHLLTKRFFVFNLSFQDVSEIRCLVLRTEHRHTKLCWVPSSPSGYLPSKTISVSLNFYHTDMMVRGSCYFVCSGSKEEAWKIGNTCLLEAATRYIQRLLQEDRILFYSHSEQNTATESDSFCMYFHMLLQAAEVSFAYT